MALLRRCVQVKNLRPTTQSGLHGPGRMDGSGEGRPVRAVTFVFCFFLSLVSLHSQYMYMSNAVEVSDAHVWCLPDSSAVLGDAGQPLPDGMDDVHILRSMYIQVCIERGLVGGCPSLGGAGDGGGGGGAHGASQLGVQGSSGGRGGGGGGGGVDLLPCRPVARCRRRRRPGRAEQAELDALVVRRWLGGGGGARGGEGGPPSVRAAAGVCASPFR